MNTIQNIDWILLHFINGGHTSFWDSFFIFITNKYIWTPLYILLAIIFVKKLGLKNGLILIAGALLCFTLTDLMSAKIIKVWVARPRPCHTDVGLISLWLPKGCGGAYGFVSNHAANTMGLAVFCILIFIRKIKGKITLPIVLLLLLYTFLNGLSRIYLGAHYPTDVLAGAALGMIVAIIIFFVINKWIIGNRPK